MARLENIETGPQLPTDPEEQRLYMAMQEGYSKTLRFYLDHEDENKMEDLNKVMEMIMDLREGLLVQGYSRKVITACSLFHALSGSGFRKDLSGELSEEEQEQLAEVKDQLVSFYNDSFVPTQQAAGIDIAPVSYQ